MGAANGVQQWAVGFLKRGIGKGGLKTEWEWLEGLTWEQAIGLLDSEKGSLTRTTAAELRKALKNAP